MTRSIPPQAERRPVETTVHGQVLRDDYGWLRAPNWQEVLRDPGRLPTDIRAHLVAENRYAEEVLSPFAGLQEALIGEMRGRMREDDSSVPVLDGPFAYFNRFRTGGQRPLVMRSRRDGSDETVLLDGDALAAGQPFYHLGARAHTDDHRLLAWSSDATGSEFYTIRVRDTATLQDRPDVVPEASGRIVWDARGESFLYVRLDEHHRPRRVFRHVLGTEAATDALIYEETAPGWFVSLDRSQSGRFCFIETSDPDTTEVRAIDRDAPDGPVRLIEPRTPGLRYEVEHLGPDFVILTNADGAEDFKIVTAPLDSPGRAQWRDLVGHHKGRMILSILPLGQRLVRSEREDALPRIVIREASGSEHSIAVAEEAYALRVQPGLEYETDQLRFGYSSMTTPAETFDYDMTTRTRRLLKRQDVPSGHDPQDYVTRRLVAVSHDGAQVPVSVLHRRGLVLDHSAPCLLYGYGSYGYGLDADFDHRVLSLVDRGFVFAVAHVRGGTEKGWSWYTTGRRAQKTNTFRDFIAAGELLASAGFTRRGRIVAQGRSAGGMLMGAIANMAPDLFAAVIAEVPFVDVLTTMLDGNLPLTPPEWPEWGNPGASVEDFATIAAYSPVDRVAAQSYPAILAVGGLTDPRVTYWEPAKWIARLRATATGGGPFVLRIDMESGHAGASGRFDRLHEVALSYAFAVGAVGGKLEG